MMETTEKPGVGILGMGKLVPSKLITNDGIEAAAGLAPGWIEQKTGVRARYVAEDGDTCSGLSAEACRHALAAARVDPEQIGLVLAATFTADYVMPAVACKIHQLLGTKRAAAFDLMANCTGFQVALNVASDRLSADPSVTHALVVGAALQSRYVNWNDPNSALYFGDGFGAAVLGPVPAGYGFLAHDVFSNTSVYESVRIRGGSSHPIRAENVHDLLNYYEINGMDVWKQVAQNQPTVIKRVLAKANLALDDVDFFIFHQANLHLINYLMGKMKVPMSRTYTNVAEIGNTAEASMAIALCEAAEKKLIKKGDVVVISGVGAGFTFGASAIRWWEP
ncbi:MAG: beta-ketoacyl-ACP synthase III [Candidatus Elarobacter sp.]